MATAPNNVLQFRDATRQQAKACILIDGLPGDGKSGLALAIGYALAGSDWKKTYAVDTENKSLDLFEGIQMHTGEKCLPFRKVDLLPTIGFSPSNYNICKENAINAGGEVIIFDSITHMWQQSGGILDLVDKAQRDNSKLNKWTAWGEATVAKEKQNIYSVIRDSRIHVISTVRVKEKFDMVEENGKSNLKSLGEQQLQMPDLKYEPDLVLSMVSPGSMDGTPPTARVVKTRYTIFKKNEVYTFTPNLIQQLVEYLAEGADPSELLERQRMDYIETIKEILDSDVSKQTMFPMLKEQQGHKETKLVDLPLDVLQTLLGIMLA